MGGIVNIDPDIFPLGMENLPLIGCGCAAILGIDLNALMGGQPDGPDLRSGPGNLQGRRFLNGHLLLSRRLSTPGLHGHQRDQGYKRQDARQYSVFQGDLFHHRASFLLGVFVLGIDLTGEGIFALGLFVCLI